MTDAARAMSPRSDAGNWRGWRNRRIADPVFQAWVNRFVPTRWFVRSEGAALFDLVSGFVYSQVLFALVDLDLLTHLMDRPQRPCALASTTGVPLNRLESLLQAGASLRLLERLNDGRFQTARRGAAVLGVPGLTDLIRHHAVFYRDMADPVAVLRGEAETGLAAFWPYVFGAAGAGDPMVTGRYSDLMAASQGLVAQETLRAVSLAGVRHLLDVGGGTGAFLMSVAAAYPTVIMTLFDLPGVVPAAADRFVAAGVSTRATVSPGSFRDDPLPPGADAITLIRVLYDHADATVADLIAKVFAALPPGGLLVVSEPMSGGARPERAGDAYFGFYTMAMRTGRARSAAQIAAILRNAGFTAITTPTSPRPYVTSVVTARKPR